MSASTHAGLDVRVLGPLEVRIDGQRVDLGGAKPRMLLAALVARRGRVVSIDSLIDTLWGGEPPTTARKSLQKFVWALRKQLGPALVTDDAGYLVELDEEAVDAGVLEAAVARARAGGIGWVRGLDAAVSAWRGDPLPELADELGIDPSPELATLHQRMLVQDPRLVDGGDAAASDNLPAPLTSFVGRDAEIAELIGLLDDSRLVTLLGPAGCGKRRLAVEFGRAVRHDFGDGVWFVDLAPVADAAQVADAIAGTLGVGQLADRPAEDLLTDFLVGRRLLLILDNCEHVVGRVAELSERYLRACPSLVVMSTSRERLGIDGEEILDVPPLSYPSPSQRASGDFAGVRLFVERARSASRGDELRPDDDVVGEIVRRLDGNPLALELAAARVRGLGVMGLRDRLDDRFAVLASPSRGRAEAIAARGRRMSTGDDFGAGRCDSSPVVGGYTVGSGCLRSRAATTPRRTSRSSATCRNAWIASASSWPSSVSNQAQIVSAVPSSAACRTAAVSAARVDAIRSTSESGSSGPWYWRWASAVWPASSSAITSRKSASTSATSRYGRDARQPPSAERRRDISARTLTRLPSSPYRWEVSSSAVNPSG